MIRDAVASGPVYHPDMGPDFAERRLAMRQETDMEHEFRLADGRWLRIRENRMRDGGRVQLTSDISAAKAAEIAIRESELRYRAVVETQTEFVTRITPEGRLTFCNDAYVRHVGLPRDVLLSPDFVDFDLIAPEDREKYARRLAALTPGQPTVSMELRSVLPDGRRTLEEWTETGVFDAAGRLVEIQATGRDVTEQRRVEAELARQREALHQSEKLAALGSLLAGVAHELNNPLSIVTGYATMLRDLSTDEATRRRGEMIHTAAERCARIVRSFLALARSEPRATAPVQLNALVEAALEMLAYGLRTADVAVEQRLDPALPTVVGDGDQLHQVVTNLVINAQQAMQGQTTPRRLTVTTAARDDEVVVEVADSGPGVPEALRARIFDPFFTTKPVGVGTGLGLSVSRGIVLAHRGSLETEGAPGGGALFRVRLPAAATTAPEEAGEAATAEAPPPATILVIDDEPDLLAMLAETLEQDGHEVAVARSGREALARIDAGGSFDLVLTDLRMPDLDGAALIRVLRDRHPDLLPRLILMTGDVLGAGLAASVSELLAPLSEKPPLLEKPVDQDALRRVVAERLATAGPREEHAP
jgi:PAS domain S-box-containing protein